jgi:protoheme IX farnesyltransferase
MVFGFPGGRASAVHAIYPVVYLANTLILLGIIALTGLFAVESPYALTLAGKPKLVLAALPVAMLVCITGALAASGQPPIPPADITADAAGPSFGRVASGLVPLRLIHPPVALSAGAFLLLAALRAFKFRPTPQVRTHVIGLVALVLVQLMAGAVNIALKTPVWVQLLHLLLAYVLWLGLVVLVAVTCTDRLTLKDQIARKA